MRSWVYYYYIIGTAQYKCPILLYYYYPIWSILWNTFWSENKSANFVSWVFCMKEEIDFVKHFIQKSKWKYYRFWNQSILSIGNCIKSLHKRHLQKLKQLELESKCFLIMNHFQHIVNSIMQQNKSVDMLK